MIAKSKYQALQPNKSAWTQATKCTTGALCGCNEKEMLVFRSLLAFLLALLQGVGVGLEFTAKLWKNKGKFPTE
jgi:hypothetical protein